MTQTLTRRPKWVEKQLEMSKYVGMRKHYTQLTQEEISSIHRRLKDVKSWGVSTHTFDRIEEKGIRATYNDIASTIYNCEILEYKIDYNNRMNRCEERVVVRGKALTNKYYNLNVVYSITTQRVVTVWLNHVNDRHATLDWSIYNEDMKVFGVK